MSYEFDCVFRRWFASNVTPTVVDRLKKSDGIDEKYELIYRPPNNDLLMTATSFCSVSTIFCPTWLGLYAFDRYFERNVELVQEVSQLQLAGMCTALAACMIGVFVCTSMPMCIYNHEKR